MQGILSFYDSNVRVLFDTGSTHSFIAPQVVSHLPLLVCQLPFQLVVTTPGGVVFRSHEVVHDCALMIDD